MTRRHLLLSATAGTLLPVTSSRAQKPAYFSRAQPRMGCLWTLTLPDTPLPIAEKAAAAVFAEITRLNQIFSDYEPSSELNQLCQKAGQSTPVPLSPELFNILALSQKMAVLSRGLFDITLAPCTRLWRRSRRRAELPDPATLTKARALTGHQHLLLYPAARTARLALPGMQLDLGGIAKGWTQDACLRLLRDQFHITRVLLDAAGQAATGSPPTPRPHWDVGLQPLSGGSPSQISVSNTNVATSGDLFQFTEINGLRYSHIIDPATGLGSTTSRQVTVIDSTGALADSLATILCLMTPPDGLTWLRSHFPEARALISQRQPDKTLLLAASPDFPVIQPVDGGKSEKNRQPILPADPQPGC